MALPQTKRIVHQWKRYPKFKDSDIPWLGKIPEGWKIQRLKYCAPVVNKKTNGVLTGLPYVGLEHIESWTGKLLPKGVEVEVESQSNLFKTGDVLFGKLRPYLAKVVSAKNDGICSGELLVLRPKEVNQNYLFNYMVTRDLVSLVDSSTYGVKMPRASWEFIGHLPILIPPIKEQKTIADFLDRETGKIDRLIGKKERQIELLKEKRTALISHAVTKGLDPNAKLKDSGIPWLGRIPKEWKIKRIKFLGKFIGGGTPSKDKLKYWAGSIPWVSPKDMKSLLITDSMDHISEEAINNSATSLVPSNSVLIVVRSGILRHTIPIGLNKVSVSLNQDMKAFVPENVLMPEYVAYLFLGHQKQLLVEWRKDGATVESIEFDLLNNTVIPIPTIKEQQDIADFLDRETGKIDRLVAKVQESIDKLREYRSGLISAAVTGKIDVREEVH